MSSFIRNYTDNRQSIGHDDNEPAIILRETEIVILIFYVFLYFLGHQLITSVSDKGSPKIEVMDPLTKFKSMYGPTFV